MLPINQLHHLIRRELEKALVSAIAAAKRAHETATDTESIAKSKYETFGLEASYLAHGQSVRVAQCQADIRDFDALFTRLSGVSEVNVPKVSLGKLVELMDTEGKSQYLFVGPGAGGLKVTWNKYSVMVVTLASPLGRAMMNKEQGDEFSLLVAGNRRDYEIVTVN
ncbi:GreA/GreB family elongation factor [Shewanella sp. Isolate13]|uniref:GreA/GreB family elongation factor n=1 Tax=Shewanella sp. Isolate13 TaxID=2908531 RepID=UPI001EFEE673|nr:GreA/GreB family elongation factor [Shewanella sp. Isolate13]